MIKLTYVVSGVTVYMNPAHIILFYVDPKERGTWVCLQGGSTVNVEETCEKIDSLIGPK